MMDTWEALNADLIACRRCPRLVAWREEVARVKRRAYRDWDYWGRPVPGFGDRNARVLIVGLAPGAHGSNRTGRMFTGDSSGETLFGALHRAGFANQPTWEHPDDGLVLREVFITAVGRCAPPGNKPTRQELLNCRPYLERELALLSRMQIVLALGRIAFDQLLRLWRDQGHDAPRLDFAHGAVHRPGPALPLLVVSYHPSRQNTQTGRLTLEMFDAVFATVREHLKNGVHR
ncbi:MAG: uracil-DNA glycosylase [Anaerolineae bacterium]|nr:uracil-DNA glycosylase [Anaerolineae bacterium]